MIDRERLIQIAHLFFLNDLSQREIADKLGLSRSQVSKLVKRCKEEGVVEITVKEKSFFQYNLEERIQRKYGIEDVSIAAGGESREEATQNVGYAAALLFKKLVKDGMKIGITWGGSIYLFVQNIKDIILPESNVYQLQGGIAINDLSGDGFSIATSFSKKIKASAKVFQAPLFVRNKGLADMLKQEKEIHNNLVDTPMLDIAILGIGSTVDDERNSLIRANTITLEEIEDIRKCGGVGNILSHHFDENGEIMNHELNDRVIAANPEILFKIPKRMMVSAGKEKANAIDIVLKKKYITHLVTDESTAINLLSFD